MISSKTWRQLTDLSEEDAIARYKSARRKQTTASEDVHTTSPSFASTLSWLLDWALVIALNLVLWIGIITLIHRLVGA